MMEMLYRYDVIVHGLVQCIVTIYVVLCEYICNILYGISEVLYRHDNSNIMWYIIDM